MSSSADPARPRVLILVRSSFPRARRFETEDDAERRKVRQLTWIRTVAFPQASDYGPMYTCILFRDVWPLETAEAYAECSKWRCVLHWESLYGQIMTGNLDVYNAHLPFDAGFYITLRENRGDPGMGYGVNERWHERSILRACFLVCNGNVLFVDWGIAAGCPPLALDPTYPLESVAIGFDWEYYFYHDRDPTTIDHQRNGVNVYLFGRGFSELVRLGHWLRPITSMDDTLPDEYIKQVYRLMRYEVFDAKARRKAWWTAWYSLFYANDHVLVPFHRSQWFPTIQTYLVVKYVNVRTWFGGSTNVELVGDVISLWAAMLLYVTIVQWCLDVDVIYAMLGFLGWIVLDDVRYMYLNWNYQSGTFSSRNRCAVYERFPRLMPLVVWAFAWTAALVFASRQMWLEMMVGGCVLVFTHRWRYESERRATRR